VRKVFSMFDFPFPYTECGCFCFRDRRGYVLDDVIKIARITFYFRWSYFPSVIEEKLAVGAP
jgi:hypothetical protein